MQKRIFHGDYWRIVVFNENKKLGIKGLNKFMNKYYLILIQLIKSALSCESVPMDIKNEINDESLREVLKIAKRHDMCHLAADGLYKSGLLDQETQMGASFMQYRIIALMRYEKINYEYQQLCALLEKIHVPFVPLKGSVLRNYYPEPWMRLSCDIDILIKDSDVDIALDSISEELNYRVDKRGEYDISLFSKNSTHLELHFGLMESMFAASKSLSMIWDCVFPTANGKMQQVMSDDVFYYHQIAHMAKHFASNGCGIRFFVDMWVLNNSKAFNKTERYKEYLREVNLDNFEIFAVELSNVWFGKEKHSETTLAMQNYVFHSGLYGTTKNHYASLQIKSGGKNRYAVSRIILPFNKLVQKYPYLETHKYLLPFYQVKRWVEIIFNGRVKKSVAELRNNAEVSEEYTSQIYRMFKKLKLYDRIK